MTQNQIAYHKAQEDVRHNIQQELINSEQAKAKWMEAIAGVAPYAAAAVPGVSEFITSNPSVWEWVNTNTGPGAQRFVEQKDWSSLGSLIGGLGKLIGGIVPSAKLGM